jgi:hypothetical protein
MQVNAKAGHEILHQVMGEGSAGLHFFQGNCNSLRFETSNNNGQTPKAVYFAQYNGI